MIRRTLTAAIAVAVLMLSALALDSDAQSCSYADAQIPGVCEIVDYPDLGGTVHGVSTVVDIFAEPVDPFVNIDDPTPTPAVPVAVPPLAVTGSESAVLGYVGTGLIAFGALALGGRRKFFE